MTGFTPIAAVQTAAQHSALHPAGPQATLIHSMWSLMLITLGAVSIVVFLLLLVAVLRRRRTQTASELPFIPPDSAQERRFAIVVSAGVAGTVIILFIFLVSSFQNGQALHAFAGQTNPLEITVTGHQWWWTIQYDDPIPSRRVTTANEIHIPVGRPVQFRLKSQDVIHSFWVPNLHGKTDLIPGHESTTWIRADRAGIYRGQCGEFCGHQHAKMGLLVVAESPEQFQAWYDAQLSVSATPVAAGEARGRDVFLSSSCVLCHRIGGTTAAGTRGPDLTHIAGRATIAAGSLENTRENLGRWIVNSQSIKPGNNMPPNALTPENLEALLDYLQSLK